MMYHPRFSTVGFIYFSLLGWFPVSHVYWSSYFLSVSSLNLSQLVFLNNLTNFNVQSICRKIEFILADKTGYADSKERNKVNVHWLHMKFFFLRYLISNFNQLWHYQAWIGCFQRKITLKQIKKEVYFNLSIPY